MSFQMLALRHALSMRASRSGARFSASVMPYVMFSRIVVEKSTFSWPTTEIARRSAATSYSAIGRPPRRIAPALGL